MNSELKSMFGGYFTYIQEDYLEREGIPQTTERS